jgi:hypothetical protein
MLCSVKLSDDEQAASTRVRRGKEQAIPWVSFAGPPPLNPDWN